MAQFQHALFFEASDLIDRDMLRIRKYFQKRQKSGGGECGRIIKTGDQTYQICFKKKEDQERVLMRNIHTISLTDGELHLTMRKTSSQQTPQPFTKTTTKALEKIFKRDIHLLYYLRDTPKAYKILQKQLSAIGCSVKLDFDEEEVVVRRDVEKAPEQGDDAAEKWELQVERILIGLSDSYVCHCVFDPEQIRVLHQDPSLMTDDIRVYTHFGDAVVVGQVRAVNRRIAKLEKSAPIRKILPVEKRFTQQVLDLPHPELVDSFDKVLDLTGMKQTEVTLKASRSPHPHVLLSGPRRLVLAAQVNLKSALATLISDTLVLHGSGARRFFQAEGKINMELVESACRVIIREQQRVRSPNVTPRPRNIGSTSSIDYTSSPPQRPKTNMEIKLGSLEDEQVNVLVVPMLSKTLTSTNIGNALVAKAGDTMRRNFDLVAATCTLNPGDVLQVDSPPSLGCSKIFFIECRPWDGVRGPSVKALANGLRRCLDLCVQQCRSSVAFPVIGPGLALRYPLTEAIDVLTENVRQFGLSASSGSLSTIRVVIKPGYANTEQCYYDVNRLLGLDMNQGGQGIARTIASDLDDITITVADGVRLQLVFGDITDETTDAVVNTTDFVHFNNDGVCKDILTIAGPEVEAELKRANVTRGEVFVTHSGLFPCEAILHVSGQRDAGVIAQLVWDIIEHCETFGLRSVAIPAICAGAGEMDPGVVAGAILQGIDAATSCLHLSRLADIRLVLFKVDVFMAFKEEAKQVFAASVIDRESVSRVPLLAGADLSILQTSSTSQQSAFLFLGLSRENVNSAMTKLTDLYQAQCSTHTFTEEQLEGLTQDARCDLQQLVETQGLYMQTDRPVQGSLTVSGLKDGVSQVMQMVNGFMNDSLTREVRVREEEDLYPRVAWCILGHRGIWERLPKTANYNLENKSILGGAVDAQGLSWSVDVQAMEATRRQTGQSAKLKRLENRPDFTLPLYWDNMAANESMKVVELLSSSAEYQTVKEAFNQTVPQTVMKIERVQNIHLRRAYDAQKQYLTDKNQLEGGAGEKLLYHGTTQDNSKSIMKTGFNRSFAGQNATAYGQGTYFAVHASYSACPTFSTPAADGTRLVFAARVLTGTYTVGSWDMKVPPPRHSQPPGDRYDSLVDRTDTPIMYVVFHDSQAYPDYLITFM